MAPCSCGNRETVVRRGETYFLRVVPINSHNGDILRHPQAHFLKSTDQAEGKFIIKSHHCGGIHFSFRENTGSQPSLSKKILIYHMGIFCHLLRKDKSLESAASLESRRDTARI